MKKYYVSNFDKGFRIRLFTVGDWTISLMRYHPELNLFQNFLVNIPLAYITDNKKYQKKRKPYRLWNGEKIE